MYKISIPSGFAIVVLSLGVFSSEAAGSYLAFNFNVDTSGLSGQSGFIDVQFNPGDSSALSATAIVTLFQEIGGTLAQPASLTGNATGSLPGTLTLNNETIYNDVFQGLTFGTNFSFSLALSGPATDNPGGTVGSAFALSLYASDGITPLLTTDPNGSVATLFLNADATTSSVTYPQSLTDDAPASSIIPVNAVPEPSWIIKLMSLLPAAVVYFGRRSRYGIL